jgi:hypothetical protein
LRSADNRWFFWSITRDFSCAAVAAEIEAAADQLAHLCELACRAVEQPPDPVVGGSCRRPMSRASPR